MSAFKNEWKAFTDYLDMETQIGIGIGRYGRVGRLCKDVFPIHRVAVRFDVHATRKEVADQLRSLADQVEKIED